MQRPTALLISIVSVLSRLIPHPANFTTLGAGSLFAGAKLSRPWNYLVPFGVLIFTDLIIGLHGTMLYVYGSFAISVYMGEKLLSNKPKTSRLITIGLANSAIFFIITNFGVWASTAMYSKTFAGLIQSYVMGIPFWRNMMIADIVFTVGFFSLYSYASNRKAVSYFDNKLRSYFNLKI